MSLVAAAWCALAASSLLLGAVIARVLHPSDRVIAAVMALGSGVLIAAVAYDLVGDAEEGTPIAVVFGCLLLGAIAFVLGARIIERRGARRRKRPGGGVGDDSSALAIVLASVLDGVPESVVLGLTALGGGVSPQLLLGITVSNLPEGMASSQGLLKSGWPFARIARMWAAVVVVSAVAGGLGPWLLGAAPTGAQGAAQAFAAGALLAMIVDTMLPEAYEVDRDWTGLLVVAGFVATLGLSLLI